jgi:hypothetical protein
MGNVKCRTLYIRKAYKEVGSLKAGFQPLTHLCRGINNEILSPQEEIKTRWRTYIQDLLTTTKLQKKATP